MKASLTLLLSLLASGICNAQSVFPVRDYGEGPDRSYRVLHYRIELSVEEARKAVSGNVTSTVLPFLPGLTSLEFDAEELSITRVTLGGTRDLNFEIRPKKLVITLDRAYSNSDTLTICVEYFCTPRKGLYFVQPDSSYPDIPWQIWTQGEDMDNHYWFPCYDFPNQKSTSEVVVTVPGKYTVVSNGRLLTVREDLTRGTKTFHWKESKPHASYLIMFAAGEYAVLGDSAGSIPLEYYVYPSETDDGRTCFKHTPAMIRFFGDHIGFPYPWEKYAQVVIREFMFGGMENTSATTLADDAAVCDARARVDNSTSSLIAHELAHQWWGDVVTCKDWRHLWLNEGFASYFDPLFHEYLAGRDEFDFLMHRAQQIGITSDNKHGRKPIVSVGSYGENVYSRGASVLHMLRFILGDQLFWRSLNHYITKHQYTSVETNDFKNAIEEATGQNLYWFFDQWVYKAGYPIFSVSSQYDDASKAVLLRVRQTQTIDSLTSVFRTPVDVEITTRNGTRIERVTIMSMDTVFALPSQEKPQMVIFDRGNWILKEIDFRKSTDEWMFQAEHATNPVDRIRAVQHLAQDAESASVEPLFSALALGDPFWAVRKESVTLLGIVSQKSNSLMRAATPALIGASHDKRPAVREAAVTQLGNCRGGEVVAALHAALRDSSYNVMAGALSSLAQVDSANAPRLLEKYLTIPSYRNILATRALDALDAVDSTRGLIAAMKMIRYGEPKSMRFAALRILEKHGSGRDEVAGLVMKLLEDRNEAIRSAAARALGNFGDTSCLPALEQVAGDKGNRAAEDAALSIRRIKQTRTTTE